MSQNKKLILDAKDRPSTGKWIALSFQHVFAMFSATVLVPMLTGLPISVALFASGVGTLIYILCTHAKVPIYLGSSFAYISYIQAATSSLGTGSIASALTGIVVAGIIYVIVAIIISFAKVNWLKKLLPPIVVGPTIMVIGLGLATNAVQQAGFYFNGQAYDWRNIVIAVITMAVISVVTLRAKGFLKIVPFLIGIVVGYIASILISLIPNGEAGSIINFEPLKEVLSNPSQWFKIPEFTFLGWKDADLGAGISMVKINFSAAIAVIPLAFVTICEHIGDHEVLGSITGKDYLEDPGLHRTLLGDGIATAFAGLIGGPANTSYGENTSVVGMTKIGSVWVTGGAAVIAILLSFCNIFTTLIASIPGAVMGGVCLILYGFIAANGLRTLVDAKVDMTKSRNLIIISVMLVIGIGGGALRITQDIQFSGMALATIFGVLLNTFLPKEVESDVENVDESLESENSSEENNLNESQN